jgi:malate synthase
MSHEASVTPHEIAVDSGSPVDTSRILTPEALAFLGELTTCFAPRLVQLLGARAERRARLAAGERLDFLPETEDLRRSDWKVAPVPADLERRWVEITGPVDRKMIINALNSGADVFMADFEDANAPTWANVIEGQQNLMDAVRGTIAFNDPTSGKAYRLDPHPATLMVRPRGLHLTERHLTWDDQPVPAALVDFGLYVFHNAAALIARGSGPYFYLPKLESHHEAEWWGEVLTFTEDRLGLPRGTTKATVLIETLPAAFEMHEILYALRDHSAGLNCGRWDYIFSFIKCMRDAPDAVLPDRSLVTMTQPCMRAYTQLAVKTCHRRGAHAMGGMAAQIPIKNDPEANAAALAKVQADKEREVADGHDGTWVAHPALVPVAREVFAARMDGPNQLHRMRDDVRVSAADLLALPTGDRTEEGLRHNIRVGIQYLEAWLQGRGAVPLYHLMEDAATAEISRTQVWQWLRHGATIDDGRPVTVERVEAAIREECDVIAREIGAERYHQGRFPEAIELFRRLCLATEFEEFLTIPAYGLLEA